MGYILTEYKQELIRAMDFLAKDKKTLFIGQTTLYPGSIIYETLGNIPSNQKIETPVFEDSQLGMCIGLSLVGFKPVAVYPRMDFLILAMNQLINHLDKIEEMSLGQFSPKVIIRAIVGGRKPLDPGVQHCQDHTEGIRRMVTNVNVVKLEDTEDIFTEYKKAYESPKSTLLVEIADKAKGV